MSETKSMKWGAAGRRLIAALAIGLGGAVHPVSADATAGSVFHFLDPATNAPVMQAEFPNDQVCAAFKQMALEQPVPGNLPRCSNTLLNDRMPVLIVVRYTDLGFSVNYRFAELSACEQFVKEFTDAASEANIDEQFSALETTCAE